MSQDLLHRLPPDVTIDLDEIRALVAGLERIQESLSDMEATDLEIAVDGQIGRILRWLWPMLDDLDEGGT